LRDGFPFEKNLVSTTDRIDPLLHFQVERPDLIGETRFRDVAKHQSSFQILDQEPTK